MQLGFVWARFERKRQDCWVGLYWRQNWQSRPFYRQGQREGTVIEVWICLVPMLPLHITHWRETLTEPQER